MHKERMGNALLTLPHLDSAPLTSAVKENESAGQELKARVNVFQVQGARAERAANQNCLKTAPNSVAIEMLASCAIADEGSGVTGENRAPCQQNLLAGWMVGKLGTKHREGLV